MRLRCKRSSAAVANLGGWGTFGALAGEPAISSSGKWEVETGSLLRLQAKCDAPLQLTHGAISVESTGAATAGGKSYEALKATTSDPEILLYLDSAHNLIRLEVPSAKVAVARE
jgi:hypothetical protein